MSRRPRAPRAPETVRLTVLVAFNGMYQGDSADVAYDETVKGWERAGLVRVEHGPRPAR